MITLAVITAETWIALLTPLAVAIAAIVQKMTSAKIKAKLDENTKETVANGMAADVAAEKNSKKLDQVHVLVNGRVLALLRELAAAYKELAGFKDSVAGDADLKTANDNVAIETERTKIPATIVGKRIEAITKATEPLL